MALSESAAGKTTLMLAGCTTAGSTEGRGQLLLEIVGQRKKIACGFNKTGAQDSGPESGAGGVFAVCRVVPDEFNCQRVLVDRGVPAEWGNRTQRCVRRNRPDAPAVGWSRSASGAGHRKSPRTRAGIQGGNSVLVLDPDGPFHDPVIFNPPSAGTILVGEVLHVRIQPVDHLVEALRLPVTEILRTCARLPGPAFPVCRTFPSVPSVR